MKCEVYYWGIALFQAHLIRHARHLLMFNIRLRVSQTQFILQFIIFLVSAAKRKATLSSHNHINILQKTNDISEGGGNVFQAQIEQNARGFFLGQTKLFCALSLLMNIFKKNSIKGFVSNISERGDDSSNI